MSRKIKLDDKRMVKLYFKNMMRLKKGA